MAYKIEDKFTYEHFRRILKTLQSNFELHMFSEASGLLNTSKQHRCILRHDVDVSLKIALRMAEIENEIGICATYMVMIDSLLYTLEDKASRRIIRRLISKGHHIGLHYNSDEDESNTISKIDMIESKIDSACKKLENITNTSVSSISFHRPTPQFLNGPLIVCGRCNAYSQALMDWYISDSKGRWRDGDLLPKLSNPHKPLFQLLIHPIWWGKENISPEDRLQEFFISETKRKSIEFKREFDTAITKTLAGVCRSKFHEKS